MPGFINKCGKPSWRARYGTHPHSTRAAVKEHNVLFDPLYPHNKPSVKGLNRDWLVDALDRLHRPEPGDQPDLAESRGYTPRSAPRRPAKPHIAPPGGAQVQFSTHHRLWFYWSHDKARVWWSYDDRGRPAWSSKIITDSQAERLRDAADRRDAVSGTADGYRSVSGTSRLVTNKADKLRKQ